MVFVFSSEQITLERKVEIFKRLENNFITSILTFSAEDAITLGYHLVKSGQGSKLLVRLVLSRLAESLP
jgi:hypothetical protein